MSFSNIRHSVAPVQAVRNMKVPNQNLVTIMPKESDGNCSAFSEEEIYTACNLLRDSGVALSIYMLYACQKDNYTMLTGVKQLRDRGIDGISAGSYHRAMKKLKECGYITLSEDKDRFLFWRLPSEERAN